MPPGEQWKRVFPGLIPVEQAMWRAFLVDHETEFEAFEYNVHVGEGLRKNSRVFEDDPEAEAKSQQRYKELTQKKIDVVGHQGRNTWIFEVHARGEHRSLGQLLGYQHLYEKQHPEVGAITLALVCRRIGPDDLAVFQKQGVRVWRVLIPGFPND